MGCKSALGNSTVFSKAKEKVEGLGEVERGIPGHFPASLGTAQQQEDRAGLYQGST